MNEQLDGITRSIGLIIPELILVAGLLLILISGLFNNNRNTLFVIITLVAASLSLGIIAMNNPQGNAILFNGMLEREGVGAFLTLLVDVSVVLTCLLSLRARERKKLSEYYVLLLAIALGCHLLLMSTHLLMAFLSLELISLSSYVLAGYAFNKSGSEGSLKFFLFGAVASAIMLYGFTILYGLTGTLNFQSLQFSAELSAHGSPLLLVAGLISLSGFLFKIAAVPMQLWAPDVYEAAPMPVIAFLSVAPKLAGLGILAKFVLALNLHGQSPYDWQTITAGIALLTFTAGNLSALWQTNPKRMMAYSSIAHAGFLLVGVAAFSPQGIQFMLFYAAVYLLMNFSVFAYLCFFEMHGVLTMQDFSGKGRTFIWPVAGLTIAMVALTGLPPTAGFTAKLFIFSGLWESWQETGKPLLIWLLVLGLLNTVIALFFYLKIPYYAFIKAGNGVEQQKTGRFENFLGLILVVLVVVIFFIPGLLMGLINRINFAL